MKKNVKSLIGGGMILSFLFFSGCAVFLLGAGAAGGYAISRDTVEGVVEKPLDRIWSAAREVMMYEGFIRSEDRTRGKLEAEVGKSQVKVEVKQLTQQAVRVRVKARTGYKLVPNQNLANEVYNKIFQKIK